MIKQSIVLLLVLTSINAFAQEFGQFTDSRDGKTYKTVKIGNQIWMAENLAFKADSGCWAYNDDTSNVSKYGYLYDWEIAKSVCPIGWQLPIKSDFESLLNNYGGIRDKKACYQALIPEGSSGFSALLRGYRNNDGNFYLNKDHTFFWSSSSLDNNNVWCLGFTSNRKMAFVFFHSKSGGFSVRCIKN